MVVILVLVISIYFPASGFLGSGPDRGRSPVEWGDFPFVRLSVCSSPPQAWLDGPEGGTNGQTNKWTELKSPLYRTLSPIGAADQKNNLTLEKVLTSGHNISVKFQLILKKLHEIYNRKIIFYNNYRACTPL